MGIGDLGGWLKQALEGNKIANPILNPPAPQQPKAPSIYETINPKVPLPSFSLTADGGYQVNNLPPGTSTFAPIGPLVMKNPGRGLPRFDPTGTYNDQNLPGNMNNFLLMPMAVPEFKPMPYMQQIGGR